MLKERFQKYLFLGYGMKPFMISVIFMAFIISPDIVKAELPEGKINQWTDIIYRYCKNFDRIAVDCQDCAACPDNDICGTGVLLDNSRGGNACTIKKSS